MDNRETTGGRKMGREVRARIEQLREKMAERGMDAYLIPTSDFHGSEYVSGYFKCRNFIQMKSETI